MRFAGRVPGAIDEIRFRRRKRLGHMGDLFGRRYCITYSYSDSHAHSCLAGATGHMAGRGVDVYRARVSSFKN
jgi:hypothetical protein